MGFFDFNLFKNFNLKSVLGCEKHEDKSQSLVKNINQTNMFFLDNSPLAKEIICNLPKSRQSNVSSIIESAEKHIKTKNIKYPESEWLGPFLENCKDIRSKDLQDIWSKILTGKMNNQNTSIRTMSVLKNMTSSEANLLNQLLKYKIGNFVYYKEGKMPKGFLTYTNISLLSEIGAIQARGVFTQIEHLHDKLLSKAKNDNLHLFYGHKGYLGKYCGYHLFFDFPSNKKTIEIPSIVLSQASMEISRFVKPEMDNEYLSFISQFLKSQNLQLKKRKIQKNDVGLDLSNGEDVY